MYYIQLYSHVKRNMYSYSYSNLSQRICQHIPPTGQVDLIFLLFFFISFFRLVKCRTIILINYVAYVLVNTCGVVSTVKPYIIPQIIKKQMYKVSLVRTTVVVGLLIFFLFFFFVVESTKTFMP